MKIKQLFSLVVVVASVVGYVYFNTPSPYYHFTCGIINTPSRCPPQTEIKGFVKPGYEAVKEKFSAQFEVGLQTAAQLEIIKDGEVVVSLCGGQVETDLARRDKRELTPPMVIPIYSAGKFVESLVVAILEDRGLIDYKEKIATYWPEFASNGKENITIETLMMHQAGLLQVSPKIHTFQQNDPDFLSDILSQQTPSWTPSSQQGYHPFTRGLYLGQILRRVDPEHRNITNFIKDEIISKLGDDMRYSLGTKKFYEEEVALVVEYPMARYFSLLLPRLLPKRVQNLLSIEDYNFGIILDLLFPEGKEYITNAWDFMVESNQNGPLMNDPAWRVWENPSYSTVVNAHSLAKIAQVFLGAKDSTGKPILSSEAISRAISFSGVAHDDKLLHVPLNFSPAGLGNLVNAMESNIGKLVGWIGAGGASIFFSPTHNVVFSYIPVAATYKVFDDRAVELWKAFEQVIAK